MRMCILMNLNFYLVNRGKIKIKKIYTNVVDNVTVWLTNVCYKFIEKEVAYELLKQ